jgi:hypothetical protein
VSAVTPGVLEWVIGMGGLVLIVLIVAVASLIHDRFDEIIAALDRRRERRIRDRG